MSTVAFVEANPRFHGMIGSWLRYGSRLLRVTVVKPGRLVRVGRHPELSFERTIKDRFLREAPEAKKPKAKGSTKSRATPGCDPEGGDANSSGKTLATVSTISLAVGVVGVGLGTYFILSSGGDDKTETALVTRGGPTGGNISLVRRW